jgi:hypothetical protein
MNGTTTKNEVNNATGSARAKRQMEIQERKIAKSGGITRVL